MMVWSTVNTPVLLVSSQGYLLEVMLELIRQWNVRSKLRLRKRLLESKKSSRNVLISKINNLINCAKQT